MANVPNSEVCVKSQEKKSYILNGINTDVLQRLSKNAARLWLTLLRLADAKTGELRIREHWFTPSEIGRNGKMSKNVRGKAMQELTDAHLVDVRRKRIKTAMRERHTGLVHDHERLGPAQTYVAKSPRQDWPTYKPTAEKAQSEPASSTAQNVGGRSHPYKQRRNGTSSVENTDNKRPTSTSTTSTSQKFYGRTNGSTIQSKNTQQPSPRAASVLPSAVNPAQASASGPGSSLDGNGYKRALSHGFQDSPQKPDPQEERELFAFIDSIVDERADYEIRTKVGFRIATRRKFQQDYPEELHDYFADQLQNFLSGKISADPNITVTWQQIYDFGNAVLRKLPKLAQPHMTNEIFREALQSATGVLGLKVKEGNPYVQNENAAWQEVRNRHVN
jgi:hypothetical protein